MPNMIMRSTLHIARIIHVLGCSPKVPSPAAIEISIVNTTLDNLEMERDNW